MKVTKYNVYLDDDRKNILVKESSSYCKEVDSLDSADKVALMLNNTFCAKKLAEEHLWLMALDMKCHLIGVFELSHGTVNGSLANPREAFVRLCLCGAAQFILAHNHPSGAPTASAEDINATKKFQVISKIMGIDMVDHIIIGTNKITSMKRSGII